MRSPGLTTTAIACVLALAGCGSGDAAEGRPEPVRAPATESGAAHGFDVERLASGLNRPTFVGVAPGDPRALWILEQPGRVLRLVGGRRQVALDLADRVRVGGEQGLLGIAFHPEFATDRRVYLHWTAPDGGTRVAEHRVAPGGAIDAAPARTLLRLDQPEENHNGGQLEFGPDGRLYLGLGDGGGAFDPKGNAQDLDDLHGKVVSIDVDGPPDPDWRVELYGLRNPWRFSFDPALGEIWVADVGQDEVEEVNRLLIERDEPPKNLGWPIFEGAAEIDEARELEATGELVWPVASYTHDDGCSITGGRVYRGTDLPRLSGRYLYGDFCSGALWSLEPKPGGGAADVRRERATVPQLTHIGSDAAGELLFASATGAIYRAVPPAGGGR